MPPAKLATIAPWRGWLSRDREIYPDGLRRRWLGNAGWRDRPVPIGSHPSEWISPTGYSSAGCSPAEPASASPVADNSTSNPAPARQSKCAAQPHCRDPVQVTLLVPVTTGVSFLLCAQGDISILRRHGRSGVCSLGPRPDIPRYTFSLPAAGGVVTRRGAIGAAGMLLTSISGIGRSRKPRTALASSL